MSSDPVTAAVEWSTKLRTYLGDATRLMSLTYEGVGRIRSMPELIRILNSASGPEINDEALEKAAANAALAEEEVRSDFAMLHAHTLMGVWGMLESAVEDLAATWLEINREAMKRPIFSKIKVPLATYESLGPEERHRFIITELQREIKSDLSQGVGQFEGLLKEVGLGGAVDERVRKALFEAQQIRNLIAHRGARADRRFVEACTHLGYEVGDEVTLSKSRISDLVSAIAIYMRTLENRTLVALGREPFFGGLPDHLEGALDL